MENRRRGCRRGRERRRAAHLRSCAYTVLCVKDEESGEQHGCSRYSKLGDEERI